MIMVLYQHNSWFYQHCDEETRSHHDSCLQGTKENTIYLGRSKEALSQKEQSQQTTISTKDNHNKRQSQQKTITT